MILIQDSLVSVADSAHYRSVSTKRKNLDQVQVYWMIPTTNLCLHSWAAGAVPPPNEAAN
jgi:hypothetical protein